MNDPVLDNMPWVALSGEQAHLALLGSNRRAVRSRADVGIFVGMADESPAAWADVAELIGVEDVAVTMGPPIEAIPDGWTCLLEETATQWVAEKLDPAPTTVSFTRLGFDDVPDMLDLTERTEPGPFLSGTIETGRYWGLRREGKLLAMAGERFRSGGWVEVSAVCVDPAAQRKGLGAAATLFVAERIIEDGGRPMLHVRQGNDSALALYEKIGFRMRTHRSVYVLAAPGWVGADDDRAES